MKAKKSDCLDVVMTDHCLQLLMSFRNELSSADSGMYKTETLIVPLVEILRFRVAESEEEAEK